MVLLYLIGAMVMLMNLLIAMMSTSYQEVVDSAKAARSIGRAEMILRLESLLPLAVRGYKFDEAFSAAGRKEAAKIRADFELAQKEKEKPVEIEDDAIETDSQKTETTAVPERSTGDSAGSETKRRDDHSSVPLLADSFNSQHTGTDETTSQAHDTIPSAPKTAEQRPADHPTHNAVKRASQTQQPPSDFGQSKPKKQKKPAKRVSDYLMMYSKYFDAGARRPQLDNSVVLEYVEGTENVQTDMQQAHEKLEDKIEKSQVQVTQQLDILKQQQQQQLQQLQQLEQGMQKEMLKLKQHQDQQTESVLAKLSDLQRHIRSDGVGAIASPSKRFSLKK